MPWLMAKESQFGNDNTEENKRESSRASGQLR
jgi:hypothetical protein